MAKISILGIKIDKIDTKKALLKIDEFIKNGKPHQIVTVNPEFVMMAQSDKEFKKVINGADLAITDGVGIIWASKILSKKPLKERVTGTDLIPALAKLSAKKNYRLFFLGADEGIGERTAKNLKKQFPKMQIAGCYCGSPYDLETLEKVKKAQPDVLFVAFGAPKQEKWINKYKNSLGIPVMLGVGGAFDYISGKIPRAPENIRSTGFEWLYRLIKQPWRSKRQLALIKFAILVLTKKLGRLNK